MSEPATLTTMLRTRASDARRWLIVTPPKPWSTITDGCPKTFRAKPCPSSCTRIEMKLHATQMSTTSRPISQVPEAEQGRHQEERRLHPHGDARDREVGSGRHRR